MTQAEFAAWRQEATTPAPAVAAVAQRRADFLDNGCVACHTFSAIPSAQGEIGPSLDNLSEAAEAAGLPLEDFIRESIVDPGRLRRRPGHIPAPMPSFKTTIPEADLDTLVQYLAENTK